MSGLRGEWLQDCVHPSLVAQRIKNLQSGRPSSIPQSERFLEKGMATHSSILAWKIPWTEEPVCYSPLGCKELDTTEWLTHSDDNALIWRQNLERVKVAQHQAVRGFKSKREMISLKLWEVNQLTPGHTAAQWWGWDLNLCLPFSWAHAAPSCFSSVGFLLVHP